MDNIIIYNTEDGQSNVRLYAKDGTVWLTQAQIAELFQKNISTISRHLAAIFDENELEQESNLRFMQIANSDKPVAFYSLSAILAVGFRVHSPRGTQFRRWANTTLKEYMQKGFVIDDDRLKNPDGRPDYFDELLERIRDIRASEKGSIKSCVTSLLFPLTMIKQISPQNGYLRQLCWKIFLLQIRVLSRSKKSKRNC